ncbi:MAG TPA: YggS family pyridoxal phosphate-dependent enzyme [Gemmata sp.]|nr:YggS family pyridoxal phosphate-dependent enzyme [Gemmata sp.]
MDTGTLLAERLSMVRERIAEACRRSGREQSTVTLVGVTKTTSPEVARIAFELGLHDLAESRPQELWKKAAVLPEARWHLIGHLQRNKLDRTVPLISLIHSVDSERLLAALAQFGSKRGVPVPVLLEVNCSREPANGGFPPDAIPPLTEKFMQLPGVEVRGLMTMAAYSDNPEPARPAFADLRRIRDDLRLRSGLELPELSMGMSGDYEVAIEEGATLVRIGTTLFEGLD